MPADCFIRSCYCKLCSKSQLQDFFKVSVIGWHQQQSHIILIYWAACWQGQPLLWRATHFQIFLEDRIASSGLELETFGEKSAQWCWPVREHSVPLSHCTRLKRNPQQLETSCGSSPGHACSQSHLSSAGKASSQMGHPSSQGQLIQGNKTPWSTPAKCTPGKYSWTMGNALRQGVQSLNLAGALLTPWVLHQQPDDSYTSLYT